MEVSFNSKDLETLYAAPLKDIGKKGIAKEVIKGFREKVEYLKFASDLMQLSQFKGLYLEKLRGKEYKGCYSIRVNDKYRIIFTEGKSGKLSVLVLELSNHYT